MGFSIFKPPYAAKIKFTTDPDGHESKELEVKREDMLAVGAVLVAIFAVAGLVFGKVHDATAIKIIATCLGAGGVSEAWKYVKRWLHKRKGV